MSPKKALQLYMAVKLHFKSDSYDAFWHEFRVKNLNLETRKDKFFIEKLSQHPDPTGLLIANLSVTPSLWLGRLFETEALNRYQAWKMFQEGRSYYFKEQIQLLDVQSFKIADNQHPQILKLFSGRKICLDTLVILDDFLKFTQSWNDDDPVMKKTKFTMKKYRPFMRYNKKKMQEIIDIVGLKTL